MVAGFGREVKQKTSFEFETFQVVRHSLHAGLHVFKVLFRPCDRLLVAINSGHFVIIPFYRRGILREKLTGGNQLEKFFIVHVVKIVQRFALNKKARR
jgi:hypothetical protein